MVGLGSILEDFATTSGAQGLLCAAPQAKFSSFLLGILQLYQSAKWPALPQPLSLGEQKSNFTIWIALGAMLVISKDGAYYLSKYV